MARSAISLNKLKLNVCTNTVMITALKGQVNVRTHPSLYQRGFNVGRDSNVVQSRLSTLRMRPGVSGAMVT